MTKRRVTAKHTPKVFDKYSLYQKAVQSADTDVTFIRKVYRELRGKDPQTLREDFCGTFRLSSEWVKLNPKFQAIGIDLDPEPLEYGRAHNLVKLGSDQQKRLQLKEANVLAPELPFADVSIAFNFSYFVFKSREFMRRYLHNCYEHLKKDGVLIVDCFGGSQCYEPNEEFTKHRDFTYYWDQVSYDPVSNHCLFHIHFKMKGQKKVERVFTYDWRLWSIPELREIMKEVGFKKTHVYWEGTTRRGDGDGKFTRTEKGESCLSWIAYIAAEK